MQLCGRDLGILGMPFTAYGSCRYFNEIALHALDVLHVVTLVPYTRRAVVAAGLGTRSATAILLMAAAGQTFLSDPEVRHLLLTLMTVSAELQHSEAFQIMCQLCFACCHLCQFMFRRRHVQDKGIMSDSIRLSCWQVMASALLVLINLVTPPPALAPVLPAPASSRTAPEAGQASGWQAACQSLAQAHVASRAGSAEGSATTPSLGTHIEQSYAAARLALRTANGIKVHLHAAQLAPASCILH